MKFIAKQLRFSLLIACLLLCGCRGLLYTSYTYPLTKDFRETPVGTKSVRFGQYRFKEPISGYGVNVTVTIGEMEQLAKEAGMEKVYYADENILSILMGVYKRRTIIVYGE